MTSPWARLGYGPWPETAQIPGTALDERTRRSQRLPWTLRPVLGEGVVQRPVFDPALLHHPKAMRAGEPQFTDEREGTRWYTARRTAFDHVLAAVAGSPWAGHLMLRGSVLLAAWLGPPAREPGDLDFVVVPRSWHLEDGRTQRMLDDIAHRAEQTSRSDAGGVQLSASGAISEDIWTYDRVPGRRLVLPWRAEGLPAGSVQMDFVFGEPLPVPPAPTLVPRFGGGEPSRLLAASPEVSLAWKLLWLVTDLHPQAKDLYDALLLAETTRLEGRLLRETFAAADSWYAGHPPALEDLVSAVGDVDWSEFRKEYPDREISPRQAGERLVALVSDAFTDPVDAPGPEYDRRAARLAPRIRECRELLAAQGMPAVRRKLARLEVGDAILIANVLLDRSPQEIDATAWELLGSPEWHLWRHRCYTEHPHLLEDLLAPLRG